MSTIAVNGQYLTRRHRGAGFGRYLTNLLSHLGRLDHGHTFRVFCPDETDVPEGNGLQYILLPRDGRSYPDTIVASGVFRREPADLLFWPHAEFPRNREAAEKIPAVAVIHDIIPTLFLHPSFLLRGRTPPGMLMSKGVADYVLLRRRLPELAAAITVSDTSYQALRKVFGERRTGHVQVVYNGADPVFSPYTPNECAAVLNRYDLRWKSYLIYFGGHTYRKNVGRAVAAYQRLPEAVRSDHPLLIIGDGYWARRLSRRSRPQIRFLPKLDGRVLARLVAGAALSLYPSLYEGFGLPVVESLRAGTLPLTSAIPSSREITGDGFPAFPPGSTAGLTKRLRCFLADPAAAQETVERYRPRALMFSWERCARETLAVLDRALRTRP